MSCSILYPNRLNPDEEKQSNSLDQSDQPNGQWLHLTKVQPTEEYEPDDRQTYLFLLRAEKKINN